MSTIVAPLEGGATTFDRLHTDLFKVAAAGLKLRLFKNNIVPGVNTVTGDFIEANFTNYAESAQDVWSAVFNNPVSGDYFEVGAQAVFELTPATTPNTIYGWYLVNGAGALIAAERFDSPLNMDENHHTIIITPILYMTGYFGPSALED